MKNMSHKDIVLVFSTVKVGDINGLYSFICRLFLFVFFICFFKSPILLQYGLLACVL